MMGQEKLVMTSWRFKGLGWMIALRGWEMGVDRETYIMEYFGYEIHYWIRDLGQTTGGHL